MNVIDLEITAFHEASHYATRNFFGHEISDLSINREGGNCRFSVPDRGDISSFQNIAGCIAGKVAEDRLRGRKMNKAEWRASDDYQRAFDCALRLSAGDKVGARMLLMWAERRTGLLVEKLWPKISIVAQELLDSLDNNGVARLTGEQIREAIA
jgi:hypothetical protein